MQQIKKLLARKQRNVLLDPFKELEYVPPPRELAILLDFTRNVTDVFTGFMPKRTLFQRFFPIGIATFIGMILLAYINFPGMYSAATNTISDLGNPGLNPAGWFWFSAGFYFLSFMLVPFYTFVHRRLKPRGTFIARVALMGNVGSSIGFGMLATFSNMHETIDVHLVAAFFSFGGMIFAGVFYWFLIIKDTFWNKAKDKNEFLVRLGAFNMVAVFVALLVVLSLLQAGRLEVSDISEFYLSIPFWEWMLFTFVGFQTVLIFIILPARATPVEVAVKVLITGHDDAINHLSGTEMFW